MLDRMSIAPWCLVTALLVLNGCASAPAPQPEAPSPRQADTAARPGIDAQARDCIALAMYWEARGEGHQGMQAVGSVILNRVNDDRFPDTPCEVVYQGGETPPCQFSWWCDGKSDRPTNHSEWLLALSAAETLLVENPPDATRGALFFHSTSMRSPWQRQKTAHIGNHVFYR